MENAGAPMPQYQCHKKVWALKIACVIRDIGDGAFEIKPADKSYAVFTTKPKWPWKGSEADQGYFVVYEDGYESWSPTKAFEEGYTRI
jgi:hypothetical protein